MSELFSTVRGSGWPRLGVIGIAGQIGALSDGRPLPRTVLNSERYDSLPHTDQALVVATNLGDSSFLGPS